MVLQDVLIAWDTPGLKPLAPDIAVIFDVRERRNWSTFDVAEEGSRPALVIEVTSPATREVDLSRKLDVYDIAEVPIYIIVDSVERKGVLTRRLLGFRTTPDGYTGIAPDERGWLWLEPVGACGSASTRILSAATRRMDSISRTHAGIHQLAFSIEARFKQAEARANAEQQARADAEARIAELEAELRRLRGDAQDPFM